MPNEKISQFFIATIVRPDPLVHIVRAPIKSARRQTQTRAGMTIVIIDGGGNAVRNKELTSIRWYRVTHGRFAHEVILHTYIQADAVPPYDKYTSTT